MILVSCLVGASVLRHSANRVVLVRCCCHALMLSTFGVSNRQMDKRGVGEISLQEFKDGLVERWAVLDDASLGLASRTVCLCSSSRPAISLPSAALSLRISFFFKTALNFMYEPCLALPKISTKYFRIFLVFYHSSDYSAFQSVCSLLLCLSWTRKHSLNPAVPVIFMLGFFLFSLSFAALTTVHTYWFENQDSEPPKGSSTEHPEQGGNHASSTSRPNGSGALSDDPSSSRTSGKTSRRNVRMGGKRLTLTDEGDGDGGGGGGSAAGSGGGPRRTREQLPDGRPNLDAVVDAAVEDGAVDPDALNAALLAVQADAAVSRAGLHRMLSARQRKPLREDSNPYLHREGNGTDSSSTRSPRGSTTPMKAENNVVTYGGSARSSRPETPATQHRNRRFMTMDDRWVRRESYCFLFSPFLGGASSLSHVFFMLPVVGFKGCSLSA